MPEAQGWLSLTTSANLVYKIFSSEVKDNGGRMQLKKYKKCYALVQVCFLGPALVLPCAAYSCSPDSDRARDISRMAHAPHLDRCVPAQAARRATDLSYTHSHEDIRTDHEVPNVLSSSTDRCMPYPTRVRVDTESNDVVVKPV